MLDTTPLVLAEFAIQTPIAALLLVMGFGFIIFVHELGHFLVAKAVGIKVTQFALGFGHAALAYRKGLGVRVGTTEKEFQERIHRHLESSGVKPEPHGQHAEITEEVIHHTTHSTTRFSDAQTDQAARQLGLGETEYRLNWLPLGGYVKMLGQEDLDPAANSDDPRSYNRKPIASRMAVVCAGVVMNAIFAVVFFMVAFSNGVKFPPAIVGIVMPGSPAATTPARGEPAIVGLRDGDVMVSINGEKPMDFFDLAVASALSGRDEKVVITVERSAGMGVQGGAHTFDIEPVSMGGQLRTIGIMPSFSTRLITTDGEDSDLWREQYGQMGLRSGMDLSQVNGQPISAAHELERAVEQAQGKPIAFTFSDAQGEVELTLTPVTGVTLDTQGATGDGAAAAPHVLGLVPYVAVRSTRAGSPAEGLFQPGDLVLKAGTVDRPTLSQVQDLVRGSAGKAVEFLVLRAGEEVTVSVTPRQRWGFGPVQPIGIEMTLGTDSPYVAAVLPDSPFAPLELITPARIETIAGQPVRNYGEIRIALAATQGPVEVGYALPLPGDEDRRESRTLQLTDTHRAALAALPWQVDLPPFQQLRTVQKAENIGQAVGMGFHKSWVMMVQTYQTLRGLFEQTVPLSEMRGPVGIADAGTQFTKRGWTYLMFFLGVISVNLAVINFLPMPILDGGLAVLLILEKLRGRPVPVSVHNALSLVGLAMLLSLVLFVTYNDISRLIGY